MEPPVNYSDLNRVFNTKFSDDRPLLKYNEKNKDQIKAIGLGRLTPEESLRKLENNRFLMERVRAKLLEGPKAKILTTNQLNDLAPKHLKETSKLASIEAKADKIAQFTRQRLQKDSNTNPAKIASAIDHHIKQNIQPRIQEIKRIVIETAKREFLETKNRKDSSEQRKQPIEQAKGIASSVGSWGKNKYKSVRMRAEDVNIGVGFEGLKDKGRIVGDGILKTGQGLYGSARLDRIFKQEQTVKTVFSVEEFRTIAAERKVPSQAKYLRDQLEPIAKNFVGDNSNGADFMRCMLDPAHWVAYDHRGRDLFETFIVDESLIGDVKSEDHRKFELTTQKMEHVLIKILHETGYSDPKNPQSLRPEAEGVIAAFKALVEQARKNPSRNTESAAVIMSNFYLCLKAGTQPLDDKQKEYLAKPSFTNMRAAIAQLPDKGLLLVTIINLCVNQNIVNTVSVIPSETFQAYVRAQREAEQKQIPMGIMNNPADAKLRVVKFNSNGSCDILYKSATELKENVGMGKIGLEGMARVHTSYGNGQVSPSVEVQHNCTLAFQDHHNPYIEGVVAAMTTMGWEPNLR